MAKLTFVEHPDNDAYNVFKDGAIQYVVQRKPAYPNRWVVIDMDGNQVGRPEQYRNDLFEQLEIDQTI